MGWLRHRPIQPIWRSSLLGSYLLISDRWFDLNFTTVSLNRFSCFRMHVNFHGYCIHHDNVPIVADVHYLLKSSRVLFTSCKCCLSNHHLSLMKSQFHAGRHVKTFFGKLLCEILSCCFVCCRALSSIFSQIAYCFLGTLSLIVNTGILFGSLHKRLCIAWDIVLNTIQYLC